MVAGFTGEFVRSGNAVEAFKWGVACGTATTFSDDLATAAFINETYEKVEVEKYENSGFTEKRCDVA